MKYEYWFSRIRPLSDRKKIRLHQEFGSAREIYYIEETKLRQLEYLTKKDIATIKNCERSGSIAREYELCKEKGIQFIPYFDRSYPKRLKEIAGAPYALYVMGNLPEEKGLSVAIVGARQCTPYGEQMAISFSKALAQSGAQIISGMARGIDGAAQRGALSVGGLSYSVLGSGVDVCYPREHRGLYMDLQERGGILSEQPPGTQPLREHFPARNRIISGLSDVVLVIEARQKSGSLITADMALEQGKDVYALPGPVTSHLSRGCHELIQQGAGILLSPEAFVEELKESRKLYNSKSYSKMGVKSDKNKKVLESKENLVYSCLGLYPKSVSALISETQLTSSEVLQELTKLVLEGYAREISRNYYSKVQQ